MHVQLYYGVWLADRLCLLEKSMHTSHLNCFKPLIHAVTLIQSQLSH